VAVPHRAVVRLVRGANYARLGPGEVLLQAGPIAFDASTFEIWGALANGGRLVLYPGERPSPDELGAVIARHGVTTLWLTAGLFQQVADDHLGGFGSVRQLLAGGDVLSPRHVRAALAALPGCMVINGYGPTEGTTFTCFHPMTDPAEVREPVPLGRPVANSAAYLLDAALRPVPVGVPGELYAGGDGLARGYLGRPDLTAERFVPAPLGDEPGGRLYATGDLARWLPDGRIEFLGRIDQQVKIRGFRIEPAEIEAVLGKHPEVAAAAVLVRQEMDGDKRLVACVVPRSIPAPLPAALRAFLKERLPEAMIPAAFLAVDALPLTASGKVDRRALGSLAAASLEGGEGLAAAAYVAPRTPEEEILANVWAELLRLPRVGVHDNFFALGGHSLLATLLISRVRDAFGVELPVRYLFEAPTVAGLAAVIAAAKPALAGEKQELRGPIRPAPRPAPGGPLPVSFAQQRLWFLDRLTPGSAAYNIPWPLRITGPLAPGALAAALQALIERHEALRTTFVEHEGEPGQVIHPPEPPALPVVDLSGLPPLTRDREAGRWILAESLRPFDLAAGPLLRATLLRLEASEHVLLLVLHHIVADGWSMEVLTRELLALDQGEPLPPLPIQYADFAWWQRHKLAGEGLAGQLAFWRERLAGAPAALSLPTDRPRPPVQSTRGASCPIDLPPDLAAGLRAACRREGVTLFMLLLAAFDALLARTTGDEDLLVGTPIANRNRGEIEGLIGFFANTLALRADLTGDPTFGALLRQVRETALAAYAHQDLPFEALVEELHPERNLSRSPLFQVMLSLDSRRPAVASGALEVRVLPLDSTTAKFDLSLSLSDDGAALDGGLEYNRDLFDRTAMARLLRRFVLLLEAAAVSPGLRLSALPVLTPAERHQVLIEWSAEGAAARLLDAWRQPAPIGVIGVIGDAEAGGSERGDPARWLRWLRWLPDGRLERLGSGHWLSELLGTRRALAEHRAARALTSARRPPQAYVAPRTPAESAVARIWQEVLEVDRVGVMDDFFDLGGHSLLVMRVLSRIRSVLHVDLPAQTLFEAPTVAALAERVERAGAARRLAGGAPPIEPAAREVWGGRLPLSSGQRRLWFFEALDPGSSVLNVPAPLRLTGRLSPAALAAALTETVCRHEALRTVFPTWEGEPYQDVRPAGPAALPLVDLAGLPAATRDAEAARLAADEARHPFDLAHGPLLRTALVRLAAAEHLLLATFHHIVTDGWSNEVFTRDLLALHEAFAAGRPSPLPPLPAQYPDFAVWQQRWLTGDTVESLVATWKRHFGDSLPVLRLPTDRPRPAELTFAGDYRSRRLPALLAERVRALGPGHGATLFMTLLAAFQALLRAYAGQDTVVVGTPVAGRGRTELEGMIGFFVNTLVLRGDLDGDPTFQELLERTRDRALGAFACQDLPFEKLVDALQPERDRSRSPLFQVMFALQSAQPAPPPRPLAAAPYGGGTGTAQFDLTLYMADLPEGLTAGVEFNTDLFDAMTMERLLGHYQDLLERVTENPQIRLSELSVPPLVERAAAPPAPEAAQPAAESIDFRRARMAARLAHLPAAQREAMERRLRGGGEDS
jgi:non-ribosomal peptide synthetase component F/acyl carrier protein